MLAFLLARILNVGLHLTILGSIVDVDFQLHSGRVREAFIHTTIVCVCILMLAVTGYIATKLLSKNSNNFEIKVSRVPIKKPRSAPKRKPKKSGRNRKGR